MRNKSIKIPIMIATVILIVYSVFSFYYMHIITRNVENETVSYLAEISKRGTEVIETKIHGDFQSLQAIALFIGSHEELDIDHFFPILQKETDAHDFKRMGVISLNGKAIMTDGYTLDLSKRDFFQQAKLGETVISNTVIDIVDNQQINVYATPIYHKNKIEAVLFATHETETLKKLLQVSSFDGAGYSYVVRKNGDAILEPMNQNHTGNVYNLFDLLNNTRENNLYDFSDMKRNMAMGSSGYVEYFNNQTAYIMNYNSVGINDWFICSVVPKSIVTQRADVVIASTFFAIMLTVILFGILLFYLVYQQRKNHKFVERMAFVDNITGGDNFNKFSIHYAHKMKSEKNKKYALLRFDVNKFKAINDLMGFQRGDKILGDVFKAINLSRKKDELCCREVADNFILLINYTTEEEVVSRIYGVLSKIKEIAKVPALSMTCGIYLIEDKTLSLSEICDRASIAKNTVKGRRDITYAFYNGAIRDNILAEKEMEDEMESALKNNEFQLYLQPKYSFETEEMVGAEALVRWKHPAKGLISPNAFIPLFEKNGFIKKLDLYMFEQVCSLIATWNETKKYKNNLMISVNLSRNNLLEKEIGQTLCGIVDKYNVSNQMLELEITENVIVENETVFIESIKDLQKYGFKVSIDDFGSGYSSLNLLKDISVDILKIDRAFFASSNTNRGMVIVSSVVQMAKKLKLITVAEGVETELQAKFLKKIGCDIAQGFLYAKPMEIDCFNKLIAKE